MRNEKGGILVKIIVAIVILILICSCCVWFWYNSNIKPVQSESSKVELEIAYGEGINNIADKLEENGVIRNATAFKIYCKMNNRTLIKAGKYEFDKNMTIDQILDMVEEEKIVDETVTITFAEGKNMKGVASIIAENTNNTEDDVFALLEDESYLDELIEKYWFIEDDIKDEDLYYSLEGYLYPDTYIFTNEDVSVKDIFAKMLDKMDSVLAGYEDEIEDSDYAIHEILSLASVVELEAKSDEDRQGVAGVFFNRLDSYMALQSDVTTYYEVQVDMGERDLTAADLSRNTHGYNTRASYMGGEIPVGPICMVSESSIKAVLNPADTDDFYFVADKNGKVYFSETNSEHEDTISELKDQGLWFTYEE